METQAGTEVGLKLGSTRVADANLTPGIQTPGSVSCTKPGWRQVVKELGGLTIGWKTLTRPSSPPQHLIGTCHHTLPFKAHTPLISQTEAQYVFGFDKAQTRARAAARDEAGKG